MNISQKNYQFILKGSAFTALALFGFMALAAPTYAEPSPADSLPQGTPELDLEAHTISYQKKGELIVATGGVIVTSEAYGRLVADELKYITKENKLFATGNVIYTNTDGVVTKTQSIEIDDQFKDGLTSLLLVELSPDSSAHVWAKKAKLKDNLLTLENAVYSACPLPEKLRNDLEDGSNSESNPAPVWQIRSGEAQANLDEDIVVHKNMWFDVYGQPVLWIPWMRHATNSKKALSGFLKPEVATSGNRGEEATLQYYWRQTENLDATLEARYMSERGLLGSAEQRFTFGNTSGQFEGGLIDDKELDDTRAYIIGSTEHVLKPGRRFGLNVQQATDDTFFDDFLGFNPSFLTSSVYAEDASKNHYFGISSTYFEDIRLGSDDDTTPQPLVNVTFEKKFERGHPNEQFFIASDFVTLERTDGLDTRRLLTELGWEKHINTDSGHLFDLKASVRGDIYHTDNNTNQEDWSERITPQISAMWQNPLISKGGGHVITPVIKAIGTPTDTTNSSIPNEDSLSFELDAANLFEENRFAGNDRIENGLRVIYGLDNTWTKDHNQAFNLFLGQSWRTGSDASFPDNSGHTTKLSDWVGQARVQTEYFQLTNRFRLNKDTLNPQRVDSFFTVGDLDNTFLNLAYSFEKGTTEEIRADSQWRMTDTWAVSGSWQQDLTNGGKLLQAEGGLTYSHCCYEVSFKVRRRGFENRNVESSTDFIVNFNLLTHGKN